MEHERGYEALKRSLKDNYDQTLPVAPTAAYKISACIKSSNEVEKLQLTTTIRVDFLKRLLTIGNALVPVDKSSGLI